MPFLFSVLSFLSFQFPTATGPSSDLPPTASLGDTVPIRETSSRIVPDGTDERSFRHCRKRARREG
ncbi:hypothetical protein ABH19_04635 [Leptospirillum sp. Group II 'CF-1']|nr:hypothetical protein ABH19_04635 [Leptospirillum sp. Group II 'CF-1']